MNLLLVSILLLGEVSGFQIVHSPTVHRRLTSTSIASASGDLQRSTDKSRREKTLYDLLGASPKDSREVLKVRYTALAKQLHPDRQISNGKNNNFHYGDLSEINAAWQILSDPKERRRYDRELAAKEFTDGVENLVEFGIHTAIPWLQTKTKETAQVVEQSAEAVNKGATQAQKAYAVYEMEQNARQLSQKAKSEQQRAKKLKIQSEQLSRTNPKPRKDVSSAQATRLIQSFQKAQKLSQVKKEIDVLQREESAHQRSIVAQQKAEQTAQQSERQVQAATQAEASARQRLEQAKKDLEKAQKSLETAQSSFQRAQKVSQTTQQETNDHATRMERAREKVVVNLQQQECIDRDFKVKQLAEESREVEAQAEELKVKAKTLEEQAVKAKQELKKSSP